MYSVDKITLNRNPRNAIVSKIPEISSGIKMYDFDSAFISGLLKTFTPSRILEVGVSNGGTTAVILQCMKELGTSFSMRSVDILTQAYDGSQCEIGYLGKKAAELLDVKDYRLYGGVVLPQVIERLASEGSFDFLILDTAHTLPGEALDFLVALPFLAPNAVVCLHDIRQNQKFPPSPYNIASNVLFNSVVADKYVNTDETRAPDYYPNTGAFRITEDTLKHVNNVFGALTQNWLSGLDEEQLRAYNNVITRHYPQESLWIYEKAVVMNQNSLRYLAAQNQKSEECGFAKKLVGKVTRRIARRIGF